MWQVKIKHSPIPWLFRNALHTLLPGLVVAEIELNSADEASANPKWLETEVADDARYYNLAASSRPFAG